MQLISLITVMLVVYLKKPLKTTLIQFKVYRKIKGPIKGPERFAMEGT